MELEEAKREYKQVHPEVSTARACSYSKKEQFSFVTNKTALSLPAAVDCSTS